MICALCLVHPFVFAAQSVGMGRVVQVKQIVKVQQIGQLRLRIFDANRLVSILLKQELVFDDVFVAWGGQKHYGRLRIFHRSTRPPRDNQVLRARNGSGASILSM